MTAPWNGRVDISHFIHDRVHPGRYDTWDRCREGLTRSHHDEIVMDDLWNEIEAAGHIYSPIILAVAEDSGEVFVDDGQHRVLIAMDQDIPWLPFQWKWLRDKRLQSVPITFPWETR